MISNLKGTVDEVASDHLVLEVGGVGYLLHVPKRDLQGRVSRGQQVKLHTQLIVRQDSLELFGFLSHTEKEIFRMLLKISGIGPKVAMNIISALEADALAEALINGDSGVLEKIPGIGKKTAQRLIVEMKGNEALLEYAQPGQASDRGETSQEIIKILQDLGCDAPEAKKAVHAAMKREGKGSSTMEILEESLRILGRSR